MLTLWLYFQASYLTSFHKDLMLGDLLTERTWNENFLPAIFIQEDVIEIKQISIRKCAKNDSWM